MVEWAGGQKARARGLGSIRWHEANANLMKKHKVKLIGESRVVPPSSLISGATDGQTPFVIVFSGSKVENLGKVLHGTDIVTC